MHNYASLEETHEPEEEGTVLVHVAEPARARWNHVEDLDSFFQRMYQYHQRHGFLCMVLEEILELIQFIFIIMVTSYLFYGIDYSLLFNEDHRNPNQTKITIFDLILPLNQYISHFKFHTWLIMTIAVIVWVLKLLKGMYNMFHFWDIKQFYNTALQIKDSELDNMTWHAVQLRVRKVQIEQQMCIHKRELSELDIYHRILRQTNYLVALVNKKLLPPRLEVPYYGEFVFWTPALRFNMQLLLFWSPWSPFQNPWELGEDYKKSSLRHELATQFGRQILWLAILNLIFSPLIICWQILYAFFSHAAFIRREPSILAARRWSLYGRLYLRHFNELEHELQARLSRAYRYANKYVASFASPTAKILGHHLSFYITTFFAVFMTLALISEDILEIDYMVQLLTVLGALTTILHVKISNDSTYLDPEELLGKVMLHTHYLPNNWIGQAHTARVRKEFDQIFQYTFVTLLEKILSPILTPYVLYFHIHPKSLDIIDFFRNFTVNVVGVGDVCSFAQMDIRKHGNPEWHEENMDRVPNQYSQAEDGKTELSLLHFTSTNPSWKPPESVQGFVKTVRNQSTIMGSMIAPQTYDSIAFTSQLPQQQQQPFFSRSVDLDMNREGDQWRIGEPVRPRFDGVPPYNNEEIWRSRVVQPHQEVPLHVSGMFRTEGPSPMSVLDMQLSASYLHNVHSSKAEVNRLRARAEETTPLLSTTNQ